MQIVKYTLTGTSDIAPGIRVFRLVPKEGPAMKFLPGQFCFIHALDGSGKSVAKRPYSIASAPDAPELEFCIKLVNGEMTGRLGKMKAGDVLGIEGPYGNFGYSGQPEAGFVAGGVGIAPFMGILRHIAGRKISGRFVMFYSSKTRDTLLFADELEKLQKMNPNIKVVVTLTRETPPGWKGESGRLCDEMILKHVKDPKALSWWVCGPLEMVSSIKSCLVAAGKDQKDIRVEGWG